MPRIGNIVMSVYREESATTGQLTQALCEASAEFLPIELDKEGTRDGEPYRYASIRAIRAATQAPLARNGLWLNHVYGNDERGQYVTTVLRHTSNEWIASTMRVRPYDDVQEESAHQTLLCRKAVEGMLSVVTEEDDDGASCGTGDSPAATVETAQQASNFALAAKKVRSAESEGELTRYLEIAKERVEQGVFHPSALDRLAALAGLRRMTFEEKSGANDTATVGDQGESPAGGGSGSKADGGRAAGTRRGDARVGDARTGVAAG